MSEGAQQLPLDLRERVEQVRKVVTGKVSFDVPMPVYDFLNEPAISALFGNKITNGIHRCR